MTVYALRLRISASVPVDVWLAGGMVMLYAPVDAAATSMIRAAMFAAPADRGHANVILAVRVYDM